MSDAFRLGIVGAGRITATSHLPAALASPGVCLSALVDPDRGRASALAAAAGSDALVSDRLEDVLAEVDGVVIATPNHTHAELALACLRAGVHVLVEKPLATSVAEGREVAEAAEKSGCVAAVGYCTRFDASVQLTQRLLEADFFGAVERFAYQQGVVGGWASESGFHLDRSAAGGGVLVTMGTHFLDRLLHWFGYPDRLSLEDDSRGGPEANALARFAYQSGLSGSARFSKTVLLPAGLVLETERGTVLLREAGADPLRFRPRELDGIEARLGPVAAPGRTPDIFALQLADFVAACRGEHEPSVPVEQGIEAIRIVENLYAERRPMPCDWYGGQG